MKGIRKEMLTKNEFMEIMQNAYEEDRDFFGIALTVPECDTHEFIVNPRDNIGAKMDYYMRAYDDFMRLLANRDVRIVYAAACNDVGDLMEELISAI